MNSRYACNRCNTFLAKSKTGFCRKCFKLLKKIRKNAAYLAKREDIGWVEAFERVDKAKKDWYNGFF